MTFSLSNAVKSAVPLYLTTFERTAAPCMSRRLSSSRVTQAFKLGRRNVVGRIISNSDQRGTLGSFCMVCRRVRTVLYPGPFRKVGALVRRLRREGMVMILVAKGNVEDYSVALGRFNVSKYFRQVRANSSRGGEGSRTVGSVSLCCNFGSGRVVCMKSTISSVRTYCSMGVRYLSTT